jgi:hypothetical protein
MIAFVASLFGTELPIMIFLTSILNPRHKKPTSSTTATAVLGGFTYAGLHLSPNTGLVTTQQRMVRSRLSSLCCCSDGQGMVKSYLIQSTGKAWVHLWGYHAIWPHVTDDTGIFVKIFQIR